LTDQSLRSWFIVNTTGMILTDQSLRSWFVVNTTGMIHITVPVGWSH